MSQPNDQDKQQQVAQSTGKLPWYGYAGIGVFMLFAIIVVSRMISSANRSSYDNLEHL